MSSGNFWIVAFVPESHASAIINYCFRRHAAGIMEPVSQAGCTQLQAAIC